MNKNFQIMSCPKTPVVFLVVSPWLFMASFSLSLRWRSRRMRGKYILFVLGKGVTILPLQCLLFVPRMHEYGQTYNKQILYLVPNLHPPCLLHPLYLQILTLQDLQVRAVLLLCGFYPAQRGTQPSLPPLDQHCTSGWWMSLQGLHEKPTGPGSIGEVKRDAKRGRDA